MFEKAALRIGQGENIHLRKSGNALTVYYTENNSSKQSGVDLSNFTLAAKGTNAYCDEVVPLPGGRILYRMRKEIIIK